MPKLKARPAPVQVKPTAVIPLLSSSMEQLIAAVAIFVCADRRWIVRVDRSSASACAHIHCAADDHRRRIPSRGRRLEGCDSPARCAIIAGFLCSSVSMPIGAMGVPVLVCGVTFVHPDAPAVASAGHFRDLRLRRFTVSRDGIAAVWMAAHFFGQLLGHIGAIVAHEPLATGATFGGVDGSC